jgi:hypothetical protein
MSSFFHGGYKSKVFCEQAATSFSVISKKPVFLEIAEKFSAVCKQLNSLF